MKEKRSEQRLLCAELVQLTYRDETGRRQCRVANLEDISASGLCVVSDRTIPIGTQVSIHYGDGELIGTVRHCNRSEIGLLLGVQFEQGCRWSSRHFRPEHLLDPRLLCESVV